MIFMKYDHPILTKIHEVYSEVVRDRGRWYLSGYPAMIKGNSVAVLLLMMPLMAIFQMKRSPFLA